VAIYQVDSLIRATKNARLVVQDSGELIIAETGDIRLDCFVSNQFPEVSRTTAQRWIEQGLVLVEGKPAKKRTLVRQGDEIYIGYAPEPELELRAEAMALDILYEDDHLLVINKPAGLVVHPGAGNWSGTLVNGLLYHCERLPGDSIRPGLVHRLDKDTSGVLVVAKNSFAMTQLMQQFQLRSVKKSYLALVRGVVGSEGSDKPIGRDPRNRQRMAALSEGKAASTRWQMLAASAGLTLLRVELLTGRTHQIRVHLQDAGHPIIGDPLYGGDQSQLKRQWLHAWQITINHPIDHRELCFKTTVPEELMPLLHDEHRAALARL